ncbi:HU family DNA-binding protein [Gymnodinialimonas ulvae]|uniref:HU family DNA-binding protein n=1 Tax=Gymnodinialimonas ulvae TaxID=3126504 RepID=UPI0030B26722
MATKTQTDSETAPNNGAAAGAKATTKAAAKTPTKAAAKPAATATTRGKATSAGRRKSTARAADAAAKPAAANPSASKAVTSASKPGAGSPVATGAPADALRRPDLIQAIADRVSLKRSEAKMVFDVVLDEIGKALDANDEVIVPPLGKMMVKKRIAKPNGAMLTVKLKRAEADPTAGDVAPLGAPLAKPGKQG